MKFAVVFGAIGIGLILLVVSSLWASLFPSTSKWTAEKAERSAEVSARLAYLGAVINSTSARMHSGPDPASAKAEFDALQKEKEQLDAEFETAAQRPHTVAGVLKWSGISLAGVGIIGWYVLKQSA